MTTYSRSILEQELIRDEGLVLHAYVDTVGKRTIGVGRNLDDVGISATETAQLGITKASALAHGITRDQAIALLLSDINKCEAALDSRLPWWRTLDDVRQRVLLNCCFNLGINGLLGFKNTLQAIRLGAYATAAASMRKSKWASQVGDRATRLAMMMQTGEAT